MSDLQIQLISETGSRNSLMVDAESVVETDLIIASNHASLPTLVSVVNVGGMINDAGYLLANDKEQEKIARLINTYYLPRPMHEWTNQSLTLLTTVASTGEKALLGEIKPLREIIVSTVRDLISEELRKGIDRLMVGTEKVIRMIDISIRKHKDWWGSIPALLLRAGITVLFDTFLGVPVGIHLQTEISNLFFQYYGHNIGS